MRISSHMVVELMHRLSGNEHVLHAISQILQKMFQQ